MKTIQPKLLLVSRQNYYCQVFTKDKLKDLLKNKYIKDYFIILDFGHNKIVPFNIYMNTEFYSIDDLEKDFLKFLSIHGVY